MSIKLYQNTSLYQDTTHSVGKLLELIKSKNNFPTINIIEKKLINLTSQVALALDEDNIETMDLKLASIESKIKTLIQLINFATSQKQLTSEQEKTLESALNLVQQKVNNFPLKRRNILILSSVMGQGHMSASKALKQGIEHLYGKDYCVTIIDFYEAIGSLFNKATVKAYEGSTKHLPSFYKYFFENTDSKWQVQFLNLINYPLNAGKLEKLFKSYSPHIIISAFPVWDYLASLVMKKCGDIKFLSVVTDSISIHHAWVTGDPDFHLVPNTETAISLKKLGAPEEKIKVLGFPVKLEFSTPHFRSEFIKNFNLDPHNFTIVLLPTAEKTISTIKMVEEINRNFPQSNLFVICGRNKELYPKLEQFQHQGNTRIIGWTDQMPEFIKNCDLVITKAGGATVMECIAAQKPMIITQVIPGQEMGNAELIKDHDLGIIQKSAKMSISECVKYIQNNHSRFIKNLSDISRPHASLDIAKFINEQIR